MLKIRSVEKNSPASRKGISAGDVILTVNGREIRDALDFSFYTSDDILEIQLTGSSGPKTAVFKSSGPNGITVGDLNIRHCGNKCIFCFIDQNPEGLRKTIYVKDEDYRYSFLYGNYFTLTGIKQEELERIVEMKLSPLYVSVHAVNGGIRKKLLGIRKDDRLEEKLSFLTSNGIEIHAQAVICPGINDGDFLKETIRTLASFYPGVRSLAVVPVGLTGHRDGLPEIKPVSEEDAAEVLETVSFFNKRYLEDLGTGFVFAADEFYLKAGIDLPPAGYYEDYIQFEDGVGMTRYFIDSFNGSIDRIPPEISKGTKIKIVTGELFYPVINDLVMPVLNKIKGLDITLVSAVNGLFGPEVTVAGLLSGKDIAEAAGKAGSAGEILIIPPTCLNTDGIFLDDMTVRELSKLTGYKILCLEDISELFDKL